MKLVVGLGNPGARYAGTRHNVGFDVVDLLAERHRLEWTAAPRGIEALTAKWRAADVVVAKPLTFMNLGGPAVVGLLQFFKIDVVDLFVVVDEINLELGRLRTRAGGSAGGHNGLKSVIEALGTTSSHGCESASGEEMPGATSRITCWRGSIRRNGRQSPRRSAAPRMRPNCTSPRAWAR